MIDWSALLAFGLACGAASVTVTKTHITEGLRAWLWKQPRLRTIAYLADCPYCVAHWIALVLVMTLTVWHGLMMFLVAVGVTLAIAAITIGTIMKLMGWDQRDQDDLRRQIDEAHKLIKELVEGR